MGLVEIIAIVVGWEAGKVIARFLTSSVIAWAKN